MHVPVQTGDKRSGGPSIRVVGASDASDEYFRPYRQLAVGVVVRAMLDLANPTGSVADRKSAQAFLRGSAMLFHWCQVAALDPWCVVNYAEKLTAGMGLTGGSHSYGGARLRIAHRH